VSGIPSSISKQRVLIVDDSKIVRTTISRLIRKSFDVREEANGEAGWKALASDPSIVVVFSDLTMPELDGFGLLERIRKSDNNRIRNIPVIVISGDEDSATKQKARAAGANDFIAKTTDGTEILSRIDNLLHLVEAKQQAAVSQQIVETTATTDPLTGAFTPHYLITEGRKHFAHVRRHGGQLSVLMLRVDTFREIVEQAGKSVADQLLAKIAKLVMSTLRTEDTMGRTGEAIFTVAFAGTTSPQALVFARRVQDQLEKAQPTFQGKVLRIRVSIGHAGLDMDTAESIEDLMKLALQRLQQGPPRAPERAPAAEAPKPAGPPGLPIDVERALQVLERAKPEQIGDAETEVLRRMLPFLEAVFRHLSVDLPVNAILQALKKRQK
jgi:diguanylate cyclase (GGDEF)-like protein